MKKIISMALIFLSTLNYFFVHAQSNNITVNGKVISFEESLALEGVSINVKGTTKNSGTQADGTFSINVSPNDKILVFKLEGYQTEEISISQHKTIDVVLKRNGNVNGLLTDIFPNSMQAQKNVLPNHYFKNPTLLSFIR